MGTGVTPKRIATKNSLLSYLAYCPLMRYTSSVSYASAALYALSPYGSMELIAQCILVLSRL